MAKTFEPLAGTDIRRACADAIALANESGEDVQFEFNGILITATSDSVLDALAQHYFTESEARCKAYRESPEGIAAAAESERREEERKKRDAAIKSLNVTFAIQEGREQEYAEYKAKNSADGYSKGVVVYAEQWAYLMEQALRDGQKLEDVADNLSHEADTEGITGFMYGCAVQGLAYFWKHGEQLRRWHNLKTQIKDEGERANESGGVLNPAVLSIG